MGPAAARNATKLGNTYSFRYAQMLLAVVECCANYDDILAGLLEGVAHFGIEKPFERLMPLVRYVMPSCAIAEVHLHQIDKFSGGRRIFQIPYNIYSVLPIKGGLPFAW